jgi:hypothetical protein
MTLRTRQTLGLFRLGQTTGQPGTAPATPKFHPPRGPRQGA